MGRLDGRVAIVTGAGGGIGREHALLLGREGAAVVVDDLGSRTGADAVAVAEEITAAGGSAVATDASATWDGAPAIVETALEEFGRVDILVNNAAIASSIQLRPFEEIRVAEWRRMQDVNAMGPFLCIRAVAPHMRKQQSGRIVNITSGTAFKGAPFMLDCVASKGAVMTMTRALARELGPAFITVNAVSPGYTLSEGNLANKEFLASYREAAISTRSLPRDAWPADIVGAVAFLASDDAAFISGQILAVDGGSVYH
jgi:NAD(P)-dependent dehydrogenase (short-subunit alcohol dehydrogenase family)